MAISISHFAQGETRERYEKSLAAMHPPACLPNGEIASAAGMSHGGPAIFSVHDGKSNWETFRGRSPKPRSDGKEPG